MTTEASKKYFEKTLPRSSDGYVGPISTVATVINLAAIGTQQPSNANELGTYPGLQNTFADLAAEVVDIGYIAGASLTDVTGGVLALTVGAAGSGYTTAPAVSFTASTLVGSFTVTAGGSGYTSPPIVAISSGGGSGAAAVAVINAAGQVTGVTIAAMGAGYTGAPTVAFSGGGGGGGAAATAVLATPTATASISAGQVTALAVTYPGAGYGSAPTATLSGGGGSGGTATVVFSANEPSLTAFGCGAGTASSAPGICKRLTAGTSVSDFARNNTDRWLGIVGSTSGGVVRVFRGSY